MKPIAQPPYILALDVGTSSTRSLLFDATGTTVPDVGAQLSYKLTTSNVGEVSVDADTLVDAVVKTIDEALKEAGPLAAHIGAVAIDTFWHTLVGVDASNNAVTPLITWEDTRPLHAAEELRALLDETGFMRGRVRGCMRVTGLRSCVGWKRRGRRCSHIRHNGSPSVNICTAKCWDAPSVASRWLPAQGC